MRLEFEHGVLRSWRMEDAPALAEAANNRKVWLMLRDRMPHPYLRSDAENYLRGAIEKEQSDSFCIEVGGVLAGAIGVHAQTDVHRFTAELGYWIAEPYWGRGIATAAVRAIVAHSFATRPVERIFAMVHANNPTSARVLEKTGFKLEGLLRRNVCKDGVTLDSLLYARLRDE